MFIREVGYYRLGVQVPSSPPQTQYIVYYLVEYHNMLCFFVDFLLIKYTSYFHFDKYLYGLIAINSYTKHDESMFINRMILYDLH